MTEKAKLIEVEFREVLTNTSDIIMHEFSEEKRTIALDFLIMMDGNIRKALTKIKSNR